MLTSLTKIGRTAVPALAVELRNTPRPDIMDVLAVIGDETAAAALVETLVYDFSFADIILDPRDGAGRALVKMGDRATAMLDEAVRNPSRFVSKKTREMSNFPPEIYIESGAQMALDAI